MEMFVSGPFSILITNKKSLTGDYISGKKKIEISNDDLIKSEENIEIIGCSGNNLKKVDLKIPLGNLVCITGVSGSGKSTLINQTLFPAISNSLNKSNLSPFKIK